jgi:tetratricopeptide (TPR) repeat protein
MASPVATAAENLPLSPALVEATLKLALTQHQRGALDLAIALYDQVLTIDAGNADAWHLKGIALLAQGQPGVALPLIERACALVPGSALFHRSRADALSALGKRHDAKKALSQAVEVDPTFAAAFNNLGVLHLVDKEIDAAIAAFGSALKIQPDYAEARNGLGVALTEHGRLEEAVAAFDTVLAVSGGVPLRADILANRSVALQKLDRPQKALDDLKAAVTLAPQRATFWRNMAKPLIGLNREEEAETACARAIEINPSDQTSLYERAFPRLLIGNIGGGFDDYRFRSTVDRVRFPIPSEPLSPDLSRRRFRLVLEQGLGEHLFFLRYAPSLMERGAKIVCEVDVKLTKILKDHPSLGQTVARDEPTPDYKPTLIGDLPFLVGGGEAPASLPLVADTERKAAMQRVLGSLGTPPYIALTWRAGIQDGKSLSKIVPLDALAKALRLSGDGTLVSVQRQPLADEITALARQIGRPVHDLSQTNDDLEAMLALLSLVDDYIGVSNTNMHLRAGLGLPARVLVPHPSEFRWLARGDRSPWFPEFSLYRANRNGWQTAMERLSADLAR